MNANRRGFLGGVFGAVAAGPSVGRQLMQGAASGSVGMPINYGNAASNSLIGGDYRGSVVARIAELRGLSRAEKRERYTAFRDEADRSDVMALRSVSEGQRTRMLHQRAADRAVERDLMFALRELAGLDAGGGR